MENYYQKVTNVLNIISYVINVCTVLGSILTVIIFSRKAFEKSSIRFYCKSLAIFDLFVIFNFGFGLAALILNSPVIYFNIYICKIGYFISIGISPIPGWILVVFSFDQLIIVSRTERFQFFKKPWFQYSIIVGLFISHCAIYSHLFVLYDMVNVNVQNDTYYSCESISISTPILYLIESSLIPFVLISISMFFVVRLLVRSRQKAFHGSGNSFKSRRKTEYKFAFNSVILNVLFIVLTTPIVICYLLPIEYSLYIMIHACCSVFFNLNFALHFCIHLTFNSIFRREFLILFGFTN